MRRSAAERRDFCESRADLMAAHPTEAGAAMWELLKPLGFGREVTVNVETKNHGCFTYILDFFCITDGAKGLCIEVDGGIHKRQKGRDRRRDTRLATIGIKTLRFTNRRVLKEPGAVLAEITEAMGR